MDLYYVIQDAITKEYFWTYRIDEGFQQNISEAKRYSTEENAVTDINVDIYQEAFSGRYLEIKPIYSKNI